MLNDPFPLGPFIVDETGRLALRMPGCRPSFWFMWRDRRFSAVMAAGLVSLSATLGEVPSTLIGAARREDAFAALRALPRDLPRGWRLRLTPEHRIEVAADETMVWPATAASLVQPLIRFLLQLSPYLDLLEEAGF
jgi:hypothetical protein